MLSRLSTLFRSFLAGRPPMVPNVWVALAVDA
jgi:hypothetical protein